MKEAWQAKCDCGFMLVDPQGREDFVKHMKIHGKDAHKMDMSEEDVMKMAKKTQV